MYTQHPYNDPSLETPCFVVDEKRIIRNLEILDTVRQRTGCRILLALKAFAMFSVFPLLRRHLDGTCASSPHEARLGREAFGGEVHTFAPAYSDADMEDILTTSDHVSFNSFTQWERHAPSLRAAQSVKAGLRINPNHSEATVERYDPCARYSRLGILARDFGRRNIEGISGLHMHTLCEQNADALERTLDAAERDFGHLFAGMEWLNLGGGHHVTRDDYDIERLCSLLLRVRDRYDVQVYLEPGEAVALNAGVLVTTVLDVVTNEMPIAILDTSASAHMPDVLEMPYRPNVRGAAEPGSLPHTFRLAGLTCLAGDVIGDYAFKRPLAVGDRLVFEDMAHYTMVKTTTFNGIRLPSIALHEEQSDTIRMIRRFGYEDYRSRLS